ncbi:nucleoside-diphosphate sugar epimerase/dehydratase [Fulvimarina sp. MAC3]|uniref:polysaccharide biosynthesis protein n=1 Tax=Fulvimarina sp. MAC3 TaxID=3148887 RepID=UPI0031FBFE4F
MARSFAKKLLGKLKMPRLPRTSLRRLGFVHDALVSFIAITAAMALSWGLAPLLALWQIWALIGIFTVLCLIIFPIFRLNSGAWRYASLLDVVSIVKAATAAVLIFLFISFFVFRGDYVPRSAIVNTWFILIVGLGGPRLAYRLMKEGGRGFDTPNPSVNTGNAILVVGYTDDADLYVRNARRSGDGLRVVGILDERPKNRRRQLHGVPVVGGWSDLSAVIAKRRAQGLRSISEIVVADQEIPAQVLSDLVIQASPHKITVKRLPDMARAGIVDENAPIEPQPIQLEDLLSRKVVDLDLQETGDLLRGSRIAVTGAGGSIGSELVRQIGSFKPSVLILIENSEFNLWSIERQLAATYPDLEVEAHILDVRRKDRIDRLFAKLKPEVVFHAAAMKHVPIVEDNPIEGIETNLIGTRNVADAALAYGSRAFVMISTDKAVNPTNVMGASKRSAEAYCQSLDLSQDRTRFMTVRFGNVLGSAGSVVPLFQSQIARGGPLTVTDPNIVRFFMTIPEATRLILHAAGHGMNNAGSKGLIYVLDMGKPVRIAELAERLIQLAGLRPHIDIAIEFTGLRKGEKLYEELFSTEEQREETGREGLFFARSRVLDVQLLSRNLKTVEAAIEAGEAGRVVECLRRIVPEFETISFPMAPTLGSPQGGEPVVSKPARPVGE